VKRQTFCFLAIVALALHLPPAPGREGKGPQPPPRAKDPPAERPAARLGEARFQNFGRPFALAFSPDGKILAAGSWDGFLTLWDVTRRRTLREWEAHLGPVTALALAPDGRSVASAGTDGEIRVWGTGDGKRRQALAGDKGVVRGLTFSPDGKLLASADGKGVRLWDLSTGRPRHTFAGARAPTFSADGSTVIWVRWQPAQRPGAREGTLLRVDVRTGKEQRLALPPGPADGPGDRAALSASGRWLVRAGHFLPLRIWELPSGRESGLAAKEPLAVTGLALAPDERSLAVACADGRLLVLELTTGQVRCQFRRQGRSESSLALSPDGRVLASGDLDRTVLLWDLMGRMAKGKLAPVALNAEDLGRLWNDLDSADGGTAHRAVWELTAGARDTVPFLGKQLRPGKATDPERIALWIRELRDGSLQTRTRAFRDLEALRDQAEPLLRKSLAGSPALEFRRRVEKLLAGIDRWWAGQWRLSRAVEVLEHVASPEARQILRRLADSRVSPRLAREAGAALQRLAATADRAE
jgi:hypothetical protein